MYQILLSMHNSYSIAVGTNSYAEQKECAMR